jgi:glycosyltransferase involved in cell wall biosynthesis
VQFVSPAGRRIKRIDKFLNALWALRGAVSFGHHRPSMRTSGRVQARAMRRILERSRPDLIFAHRLEAGALLLRSGVRKIPIVLDMDDIEHVRLSRLAEETKRGDGRMRMRLSTGLARFAERRIVGHADLTLVCSELDKAKLLEVCPRANILVAPNTAIGYRDLPDSAQPIALFVGIGKYLPNREAISWFARHIWPRVTARVPDARFVLVGQGFEVLDLDRNDQIDVVGFKEDLAPLYQAARVVVCPIRRGGGTRIKIIEAAMSSRAVVSTALGAEGLDFVPATEILLADAPEDFAAACIELLRSPRKAREIGFAARARADSLYGRSDIRQRLADACRQILETTPTVRD